MVRRFLIFALSFGLASWVGGCLCLAQAISFAGLGIRPAYPEPSQPLTRSWFIYQLASGESKDDAVVVSNNSSRRIKAKLYAVDATTTKDGAFALLGEKDSQQGIGAWVKLAADAISLAAGEEKIVPFKITLPATIKAGDYLGGVVVEDSTVNQDKGINMVTRVGVRIYETVPGELVSKLGLKDFFWKLSGSKPVFYLRLANEGNLRLTPKGKLKIKTLFLGQTLYVKEADLGIILPGKEITVPLIWPKAWSAGVFLAEVGVVDVEGGKEINRTLKFAYLNQGAKRVMIAFFVFSILALVCLLYSGRRRGKGYFRKRKLYF
ncbi:MAG TPA: DUF916 domain-containing protein [Patescibacteria group bacterium]|nr:DUF916 domain-containing protein [Patescibacteria group bacterium]